MLDSTAGYSGLDPGDLIAEALDLLHGGRPDWWNRAACRGQGVEMFFVERGQRTDPAKALCANCTVRAECLQHAVDGDEEHGIWGGLARNARKGLPRSAPRPQAVKAPQPVYSFGSNGMHVRWHANRGVVHPDCPWCQQTAA